MVNKTFEAYKIKRELRRSGKVYKFVRAVSNEFGEPSGKLYEDVGTIAGLYHEQNEHITVMMDSTTQVRTKKTPSILCLYEDVASLGLIVGDKVEIGEKTMLVTGIVNIQEWSIVADISLEVVDNGV